MQLNGGQKNVLYRDHGHPQQPAKQDISRKMSCEIFGHFSAPGDNASQYQTSCDGIVTFLRLSGTFLTKEKYVLIEDVLAVYGPAEEVDMTSCQR